MQYGAIPTSLAERVALLAGVVPIPALDTLFGLLKARVIMAGVRLGVFEGLKEHAQTAHELAARLALDPSSLELLLRCLVFGQYLELQGDRFSLSPLARRSMVSGAPKQLTGFVQWNYTQWEFVEHLEALVTTGRGVAFHETLQDSAAWGHYQQAMLEHARLDAPVLARHVPVRKGATRLLDLGGSHGLMGAAICRKHPPLRSTVLDLPAAVTHARAIAAREGHADLVEHREGDLLHSDYDHGWDVILLSNVLHHFPAGDVQRVLTRAAAALAPQGTIAIWDLERPQPGSEPGQGDGVALFFRLTSSAAAYSGNEYAKWLSAAGLHSIKTTRPRLRPGTVLLSGRK